jgi:hypothetical protein
VGQAGHQHAGTAISAAPASMAAWRWRSRALARRCGTCERKIDGLIQIKASLKRLVHYSFL